MPARPSGRLAIDGMAGGADKRAMSFSGLEAKVGRIRPRALVADALDGLRSSYWAVPALIATVGLLGAVALVFLDARLGDEWLARFDWFYASRPSGAREVLSTIAGSTITVAGVVFSITLAAFTYASGQYGPQILTNFSRDRGNQVALGVFIGTYLYCLVVLRTIRSAEEASADTAGAVREAFVPDLAVLGAMTLAVLSIGVLVYFVHHVTVSIHIDTVIARIGRGLLRDAAERGREGVPEGASAGVESEPPARGRPCPARAAGYVRAVDRDAMLRAARRHGLAVRVAVAPGDFVRAGDALAYADGADDEAAAACLDAIAVGSRRSDARDLSFGIDELVQIAARALSPGVNDPFTAMSCMDWLGAALAEIAVTPPPPAVLRKDGGVVALKRRGFDHYLHRAFGRVRPYAARDRMASAHLLGSLARLADAVQKPADRALVEAEAARLRAETDEGGRE